MLSIPLATFPNALQGGANRNFTLSRHSEHPLSLPLFWHLIIFSLLVYTDCQIFFLNHKHVRKGALHMEISLIKGTGHQISTELKLLCCCQLSFPCGSAGKESACYAGDLGLIPGLGRSPGNGKGYPLQYSGLSNSMDGIFHRVTKSRTRVND